MIHVAALPLDTCFICLSTIVCKFMSNCYFCILVIPIKHWKCWIFQRQLLSLYIYCLFLKEKHYYSTCSFRNTFVILPHKHVEYCRQCQLIIVRYSYGNNSPWNSQMGYCYKRFHSTNLMWFHCMWLLCDVLNCHANRQFTNSVKKEATLVTIKSYVSRLSSK